ncbi:MAG: hypothetical protein AAB892_00695 [Patescibacteria group bacterium]
MRILSRLLDLLFPPRPTARLARDAASASVAPLVSPEARSIAGHEGAALLPYHHPLVQALVIEAKYHGNRHAQSLLGTALGDYLAEFLRDMHAFSERRIVLVPIPLGAARLRERGYNQTECICRAAIGNGIEMNTGILVRTRETVPQTTLSKSERLKNMTGAFAIRGSIDPSATYIVFDDVVTTGTTLASAISALTQAGASRVSALSLAH